MSADEYVNSIVAKYAVDTGDNSPVRKTAIAFKSLGEEWAAGCLRSVSVSGSFAKLTAVSSSLAGGSDIDLFISLTSNCNGTMKELYESLHAFLTAKKFTVKRQNVSLGIKVGNVAIDFVPGRHQGGVDEDDHTLYVRRGDTWKKTNIQTHIKYVLWSGYTTEIKALKIWKRLRGLDFLSFYVELFAIRAIQANASNSVAANVWTALTAIRDHLNDWQVIDPANSNNVISDQHTYDEKKNIMAQAGGNPWQEDLGRGDLVVAKKAARKRSGPNRLRNLYRALEDQVRTQLEVRRLAHKNAEARGDAAEQVWLDLLAEQLPHRYKVGKGS